MILSKIIKEYGSPLVVPFSPVFRDLSVVLQKNLSNLCSDERVAKVFAPVVHLLPIEALRTFEDF